MFNSHLRSMTFVFCLFCYLCLFLDMTDHLTAIKYKVFCNLCLFLDMTDVLHLTAKYKVGDDQLHVLKEFFIFR